MYHLFSDVFLEDERLFFSHRPLDVYQTKVSPLTDQIQVSDVSYLNQTSIQTGYNLTKIVLVLMRAKQRMSGEYKCEVLLEVKCDRDSQNHTLVFRG